MLDVASGTAAVAIDLPCARLPVVGVDQSAEMLAVGRAARARASRSGRSWSRAESLPFGDASSTALTFTYLFRYVDDPVATLRELQRVVRPGGTIASLEFAVPRGLAAAWELYVRVGLPPRGRDLPRLA